MNWRRVAWVGLAIAAVALEGYTLEIQTEESNDTVSELTRISFWTHTDVGRGLFLYTLDELYRWFPGHILEGTP